MEIIQTLRKEAEIALKEMAQTESFKKLGNGTISIAEYKSILRELYFYTRETPQLAAQMTVYFRGPRRELIRDIYRHSIAEVGHHNMALKDLEALGENISNIPFEYPAPSTVAFLGYAHYQMQFLNPIGLLGIMFYLEYLPSVSGKSYVQAMTKAGIPEAAMSFIAEHAVVDASHIKLVERYLITAINNEQDLEAVIFAIRTTAKLYGNIFDEAIKNAASPRAHRVCFEEVNAYSVEQTYPKARSSYQEAVSHSH